MFSSLRSHLSSLARALSMALTASQSAELAPAALEELVRVDVAVRDENR